MKNKNKMQRNRAMMAEMVLLAIFVLFVSGCQNNKEEESLNDSKLVEKEKAVHVEKKIREVQPRAQDNQESRSIQSMEFDNVEQNVQQDGQIGTKDNRGSKLDDNTDENIYFESPLDFSELDSGTKYLFIEKLKEMSNGGNIKAQRILCNLTYDKVERFLCYKKAAEYGDLIAQKEVANAYESGSGVNKSESEAARWIEKAAEQGDIRAQTRLASMYFFGKGVTRNETKAFEWYKKAALQGDMEAQRWLGNAYKIDSVVSIDESGKSYRHGFGVATDEAEALKWYKKAALQGDVESQKSVDQIELRSESITSIKEKAENGDIRAQRYLGGVNTIKDRAEAFKWYKKAAEQGDVYAQKWLGMSYRFGFGIPRNEVEAFKWYERAANQGDAEAQKEIASAYNFGRGVTKDETKSFIWYEKVALQGDMNAQVMMGDAYRNGRGVAKDGTKAYRWYKKAALQGDSFAQKRIDEMELLKEIYPTIKGKKTKAQWIMGETRPVMDKTETFKQNEKAAMKGDIAAQRSLAMSYYFGIGVAQDKTKGFEWYKKAAMQGDISSQKMVARAYETGNGVAQNKVKAQEWYRKAQAQEDGRTKRMTGSLKR